MSKKKAEGGGPPPERSDRSFLKELMAILDGKTYRPYEGEFMPLARMFDRCLPLGRFLESDFDGQCLRFDPNYTPDLRPQVAQRLRVAGQHPDILDGGDLPFIVFSRRGGVWERKRPKNWLEEGAAFEALVTRLRTLGDDVKRAFRATSRILTASETSDTWRHRAEIFAMRFSRGTEHMIDSIEELNVIGHKGGESLSLEAPRRDTPLDETNLSLDLYSSVKAAGLHTLRDLANTTSWEFLDKKFTAAQIDEIEIFLNQQGIEMLRSRRGIAYPGPRKKKGKE